MNIDEADAIIAELNLCFPHAKINKEVVKRWEQNLLPFDYRDARVTVKTVEETCEFWPSWAKFLAIIRPLNHRRILDDEQRRRDEMHDRQLEAAADPEAQARTRAMIAQIKQNLAKQMLGRNT